ncbi:uncharacterized protein SPPG_01822 [Spizellomyces punctatus DAOM BR117]|uniref:Peptide hydrolase n=1 Tax=Spizellomyces punctatus (strain DAOM BR117) TaxID=645134 RepID=A0A0L0HPL4_SPIPD|nr:uncharacterized protein SPPG_01822 [Spizellomyces punctatus DAOM BR117]KND02739.1 hypothetical protein SPPG_01822 [Spizellomyces punctatus DAOM BR117]|eukprot:XP_016610778.1 hypothetical protein SPPG_01822 [Spizellomyces punctatus DAOM BR117]
MHKRTTANGHQQSGGFSSKASKYESLPSNGKIPSLKEGGRPSNLLLSVGLLIWVALLATFGIVRHHTLPQPLPANSVGADGITPVFSEDLARETIRELTNTIGLRVVGTKQEEMAKEMILEKLYDYRNQSSDNPHMTHFDIDVQMADGSHRFDLMGQAVLKTYSNITNILARLSCGPKCNENAILLNSHFDSTIVSPGAADDGVGVAVMLDLVRVLSQTRKPLRNSVIFLWNGAEETLQDASHAFVTQHDWRDSIRGVINLEAMGQGGKEILFQANSKQMVDAYKRAPHPHGSVLSNDVFRTGLVMSDTDFRQFRDHGGLVGLDMAYYTNSYLYHTMLDVEETIEKGSIQNFGDNALGILDYLLYEADLTEIEQNDDIIFFDVMGFFFVHYSWDTAHVFNGILILVAVWSVLVTSPFKKLSPSARLRATITVAFATAASQLVATVICAVLGALLFAAKVPMMWFAREWYALVLFAPAGILGALLPQKWLQNASIGQPKLDEIGRAKKEVTDHAYENASDPILERAAYDGLVLFFTGAIFVAGWFKIGAGYLMAIYLSGLLLGKWVDLIFGGSSSKVQHLHPLVYFTASSTLVFTTELLICAVYLFVPITGRMGADTPVDVIMGILAGGLLFFAIFILVPFVHRLGRRQVRQLITGLSVLTLLMIAFFVTSVPPYDQMHPKRVFVGYKENVTDNSREVLLSHADPAGFQQILAKVEAELGSKPVYRGASMTDRDWSSIYPFSHFIEGYSFNVSHLTALTPSPAPAPQISVEIDSYDEKTDLRTLSIRCYYPHYIWTVLSFEGYVIDWSLSDRSMVDPSMPKRYRIRNAGGYTTNSWNLTLTLKGRDKIQMEISGLERDGFHELVVGEPKVQSHRRGVGEALGRVEIGQSWKWSDRWGSAAILSRVESVMPDWTTGLFVGLVVKTFEL